MPRSASKTATENRHNAERAPQRTAREATAAARAAPAPDRERVEWDRAVPGLGLRRRGGAASWIVQTRIAGRTVKRTLGPQGALSEAMARDLAADLIARLRADGSADGRANGREDGRADGRAAGPDAGAGPDCAPAPDADATVAAFASRWLEDCAPMWKASTRGRHAGDVTRAILPGLGAAPMASLGRAQVTAWREALGGAPASGNRALAVLSGMCRHAELVGLRAPGTNPCAGMRRRQSGFTARYLTAAEYRRLGAALSRLAAERPECAALIRFVALTGCRVGEARALRWDWIDGPRAALPDSKSGPKAIWLGETTRRLLAGLPNVSPFVFGCGAKPVAGATLSYVWSAVRADARLEGLRLHDLRHGFASVAVGAGETLHTVAGMLGHSELAVTQGYARFAEAPVREAADRVGAALDASLRKGGRRGGRDAPGVAREDARLVERYQRSRLTLRAFCATHDLDPAAFHRTLRRVMGARAEGAR